MTSILVIKSSNMKPIFTLLAVAASISLQAQIVTISEIQFTSDPSGDSPYNGQTVQTTGVVTASAEDGNLGYVFIQEEGATEWGAIQLTGNPALANLKIGDLIGVQGTVQENAGFTVLGNIPGIEVVDSNVAITPIDLDPDYFSTAPFSDLEKYESMYVQLINGSDSVYIVDPDVGFGDYRAGTDINSASTGCLVLAGRQDSQNMSSLNVSYVSDSIYATNSGTMMVPVIEVQTGDAFTSIRGVITYGFSDYRLIPRNNADIGDQATGLSEMEKSELLVYPNPSEGVMRIRNVNSGTLKVIDSSGMQVLDRTLTISNATELNLNHLPSGMYVLMLVSEDKTYQQKIVLR